MSFEQGFVEELEKIAWRGRYYHGTTPEAEAAILREGLDPAKGGKGGALGAMQRGQQIYERSWDPQKRLMAELQRPIVGQMMPTTGKVYVTPSKTVARAYSAYAQYPDIIAAGRRLRFHPIRAVKRFFRQPIEISPSAAKELGLKLDPDSPLAYFTEKKVPPSKLRVSSASGQTFVDVEKALRGLKKLIKRIK